MGINTLYMMYLKEEFERPLFLPSELPGCKYLYKNCYSLTYFLKYSLSFPDSISCEQTNMLRKKHED